MFHRKPFFFKSELAFPLNVFSSPAPGHFDGDDILDFMVHNSVGAWPHYSSSNVSLYVVLLYISLGETVIFISNFNENTIFC